MNENQNELFRQEAVNHQSNKLDGDVVIKPTMSSMMVMALIMLTSACFFVALLNYQVVNLIYLAGNIRYLDKENKKTIAVILVNQDLVNRFRVGDVLKVEYKNFPKLQYGHYEMKITSINAYKNSSKEFLANTDNSNETIYELTAIPDHSYINVKAEKFPVTEGMEFRASVHLGRQSLVSALFDVPANIGMVRD